MGRPKKGELVYRKNLRKNNFKPAMKPGEKTPSNSSNHSSFSGDFINDEGHMDQDVYDPLSSSQRHDVQSVHEPISDHLNHHHRHQQHLHHHSHQQEQQLPLQQQHQEQQPQQQQQASGFSLGTLLHDCMTVDDWDGSAEMDSTAPEARNLGPEMAQSVSPHQRQTSPTTMPSDTPVNIQQAHQHHLPQQSRHHLQMHQNHQGHTHHLDLSHIQQDHVQHAHHHHHPHHQHHHHPHHQQQQQQHLVSYQEIRGTENKNNSHRNNPSEVMHEFDYLDNEDLGQNRIIKAENNGVRVSSEEHFPDNVNIGDIQHFQTLSKVNFQQYSPQELESNSTSFVSGEHHPSPIFTSGGDIVDSVSHMESSVASQIIVFAPSNQSASHGVDRSATVLRNQSPGHNNSTQHQSMMNAGRKLINLTPIHAGVINLSQNQNAVSLQNTTTPEGSENIVVGISQGNASRTVLNGTNIFLLGKDILGDQIQLQTSKQTVDIDPSRSSSSSSLPFSGHNVSLVGSVYANNNNKNSNNNNNNNNNNNIISQAMAIASSDSNEIEESLYLGSDRKTQPMIKTQQSDKGAVLQNMRDFEELLLTKFNSKQNKEPRFSHTLNDLITKKQVSSNDLVERGKQLPSGNGHNFPSTTGHHHILTSMGSNPSTYSQHQNPCLPNFLEHAQHNENDITSNDSTRSGNANSVILGNSDVHNLKLGENSYQDVYHDNVLLDSAALHETNRIFMAIDNSCDANGCFSTGLRWKSIFDEPAMMTKLSAIDFSPDISHRYWHSFQPTSRRLTPQRQKTIDDICKAFNNLHDTYMSSETDCPKPNCLSTSDFWQYIQQTIARHVVAGQRFCKNIPDYLKLDIQDRISLGKHVGFGLMVLIACTEFYDPATKGLKEIWTSKMPVHGALFTYREHLLSLGDRMYEMGMDRTESALLCGISMTSIDCPELVKPDTVSEVQNVLIDALEAHITVKNLSTGRLQTLLSLMPQVRLMTVWYNNLMKKMSLPYDVIKNKICKKNCLETSQRIVKNMS